MSVTQTLRFGIFRWSSGADAFTRDHLDASHGNLEALAAGYVQDVSEPTPGAEFEGFIFFNTGNNDISYCDGTVWHALNAFGTPGAALLDDAAAQGVATTHARSDHKHGFPGFGTPVDVSSTNLTGVLDTLARSDHQHGLSGAIIDSGAFVPDAVATVHIQDDAVTNAKLAPNSVGATEIITGSITGAKIGTGQITSDHILDGTIDSDDYAAGSIDNVHINTVDGGKVTTGTVAAARIAVLDASKVTTGSFGTGRIPNLDASKTTSGSFATARIPSLAASKINSGQFSTSRIPGLPATQITSGDLPDLRAPEKIKTTFDGAERSSRIFVNNSGPSGGAIYDIWIEY